MRQSDRIRLSRRGPFHRAQEAAQLACDCVWSLHRADVARSGEHDEFGSAHRGLYRLADRDGSAYVMVGVQQERRYADLGQYVALVLDARTGHGPEAAGTELPDAVDEPRNAFGLC